MVYVFRGALSRSSLLLLLLKTSLLSSGWLYTLRNLDSHRCELIHAHLLLSLIQHGISIYSICCGTSIA
jgi:hypothetical protein